jgi:hypothetical protein
MNLNEMITTDDKIGIGHAVNCASRIVAAHLSKGASWSEGQIHDYLYVYAKTVLDVVNTLQEEVARERKTRTDSMVDNAMQRPKLPQI